MMEENKPWDTDIVNVFTNGLWSELDIVRGSMSTSEYPFLLYFLLLKRDQVLARLKQRRPNEDLKSEIHNCIFQYEGYNSDVFKEVYELFAPAIYRLNNPIIYDLLYLLDLLDESLFKKHFPKIFDALLYRISKSEGKYGSGYMQPLELSRFVSDLADLPIGAKVYNPFAGVASFGIILNKGSYYFGQEISQTTRAIGMLRIIAYNREATSTFELGDSIQRWNPLSDNFDLIVANPPFNMKLSENRSGKYGTIRTYEHFLIEKGISDLHENGKLITTVPLSFLIRSGSEQNLRVSLLENDLLETVISFPGGLLTNSSIPFAVIVINKNKKEKRVVRFIDASNFVENISPKEKRLNDFALNALIKSGSQSESLRIVSNQEIIDNDCSLNALRYLTKAEDDLNVETIALGDIAKIQVKEGPVQPGTKGRFIRIRDLKTDILDGSLKPEELEVTDVPSHTYSLKYASLLLALRFKKLKPTMIGFGDSKEPVFISNDILALNVDEDKVDVHYLISELNSEFVQRQVEMLCSQTTIPSISKKDILRLRIRLLPKEEQRKQVQVYLESLYRLKDKELAVFKDQFNLKIFSDLASLKHSLGRPLLNVGSGIRTIQALISKTSDIELQKSLESTFHGIKQNLLLVNNFLERNENELNLDNYKLEEFELLAFLKEYVATENHYSFMPQLKISQEITTELNDIILINGNQDLLSVLFNDILDNAERHAFKSEKNSSNQLIIELKIDLERSTPMVSITVKNNGIPFPENFDKEKFIKKNLMAGVTGNTGIGGYDIFRIVDFMKGMFDLKLNEDNQFPTVYEIELPIQNTKDDYEEEV